MGEIYFAKWFSAVLKNRTRGSRAWSRICPIFRKISEIFQKFIFSFSRQPGRIGGPDQNQTKNQAISAPHHHFQRNLFRKVVFGTLREPNSWLSWQCHVHTYHEFDSSIAADTHRDALQQQTRTETHWADALQQNLRARHSCGLPIVDLRSSRRAPRKNKPD